MWSEFWHDNDDTTYGKKQNSRALQRSLSPGGAGAQVKWALVEIVCFVSTSILTRLLIQIMNVT